MGRLTGFEPATTRITTEGSTAELQSPYNKNGLMYIAIEAICPQKTIIL